MISVAGTLLVPVVLTTLYQLICQIVERGDMLMGEKSSDKPVIRLVQRHGT